MERKLPGVKILEADTVNVFLHGTPADDALNDTPREHTRVIAAYRRSDSEVNEAARTGNTPR